MLKLLKKILKSFGLAGLTRKFLKNFNYNLKTEINGRKYTVPIIRNIGYDNKFLMDGLWKSRFFSNILVKKPGDFIDVGANIGQTLLSLRSVNEDARYIGFEPNPACVFYMNNLIRTNQIKNAILLPVGLFQESGTLKLDIQEETDQAASIITDLRPGKTFFDHIYVPLLNFTDITKSVDFKSVSLVKIDVEGAELQVLETMKDFISHFKPLVICEILWSHNQEKLPDCAKRNEGIINLLNEINYSIYQIHKSKNHDKIEKLVKINSIENKIFSLENEDFCDYLFASPKDENLISELK